MKIIYQADDGAKFENEAECRNYEQSRKICNAISERKLRVLSYNAEVMRERFSQPQRIKNHYGKYLLLSL